MAEDNKPARMLEPGAIERTRKNIGHIDEAEALAMQKKLGGEILKEKPVRVEIPASMSRNRARHDTVIRSRVQSSNNSYSHMGHSSSSSSPDTSSQAKKEVKKIRTDEDLPEVSAHDLRLMNHLLMQPECGAKHDYGFLNFFYSLSTKNRERVQKRFGEYIVKRHVDHIQTFVSTIKTFIQIAPNDYKAKIATETDLKYKFLRTAGNWSMRDIKVLAIDIENASDHLTVPALIPFVRAVYSQLLKVYYIGEQKVSLLIKEIYNDLLSRPNSDKQKLNTLVKEGMTEWLYLHDQVIRGMYPLLMRMCSDEYVDFPDFFRAKIADILKFLKISKFDLLLPEKKKVEKVAEPAKETKKREEVHVAGKKDDVVNTGLKILEQLFPKAGFLQLDNMPDMYPYFQPIYGFEDGFNMLSPGNPLQVTIVLIIIIEDFIKGCRNVDFNIEADEKLASLQDKLDNSMNDWMAYYEDLFSKKLGDYLRDYVNSIYSQKDYENSQFGKENLNNVLWRIKYYFLPHYKFNAPVLTKPINDTKYRPLYLRTDYLRTVFTSLVKRIDESAAEKKNVVGIMNPWEKYVFDLPTAVSRRLDVLLGAKRDASVTQATNANLVKYTYCIIAVLDWWINNPASPAYTSYSSELYRISKEDGAPQFSVPERTDQNQLFADSVKRAIEARKKKTN